MIIGETLFGEVNNMVKSKEQLEREHSEMMNKKAVEKAKEEVLTKAEADRIETVFFEDDIEIKLRDGITYKIHPCTLKDARKLMRLVKTVNIDAIILNFLPLDDDEDEETTEKRQNDLYDLILLAFKNYSHIDREYVDTYVDLDLAKQIIEILLGINGIRTKK